MSGTPFLPGKNNHMAHQFIILGMHRSGTSLAAGLLHNMGISAGSSEMLMPAADENPKGFWERVDVMQLNDEALASCNATWDHVTDFNLRSLPAEAEKHFHEQACVLVATLESESPWFVKDPRICLLLPLWQKVLKSPFFVLVSRNPIEIALSLRVRNLFPINYSLALWEHYMLSALRDIQGSPAIIISHSRLLADPLSETTTVFNVLQALGSHNIHMPLAPELNKTVNSELHHQRCTTNQLQSFLNFDQLRLYKGLEDGSCLQWPEVPQPSTGGHEALVDYSHSPLLQKENFEQRQLLDDLSVFNKRLFSSYQYRLGSTIGGLIRTLFGRTKKHSLPEQHIRRTLEQFTRSKRKP